MSNDTTRRRSRKKNRLRGLKAIDWVRDDLAGKLPEGEYAVLLLLSTRCDGDYKCFPGIRSIAATLRRNERTIIRRLNRLEERGLIHKKRRPNPSEEGTNSR